MPILEDIIDSLDRDATVWEVRIGVFWTAVVSRGCGLASTLVPEGSHHLNPPLKEVGRLIGRSALELAHSATGSNTLEAGIGVAAINSLIQVEEERCVELNAADFLEEKGRDRKIALVGHFPFVPRLRRSARALWVIEQELQEGDLEARQAAQVIPQADVVAITGSAFVNGTIQELLQMARRDSLVMVLGPSTPMSPVLFDYGVDVLSGVKVVDWAAALHSLSQGATFRQMEGVKLLTMTRREVPRCRSG